jgi:hypothetical protein
MQVTNVNTRRRALLVTLLLVTLSYVLISVPSTRAGDNTSATTQDMRRLVQGSMRLPDLPALDMGASVNTDSSRPGNPPLAGEVYI